MNTLPPPTGPTRVFWSWNRDAWVELKFLRWTKQYLVVEPPSNSLQAGKPWRIHHWTVLEYHKQGALYITGEHPFQTDVGPKGPEGETPSGSSSSDASPAPADGDGKRGAERMFK